MTKIFKTLFLLGVLIGGPLVGRAEYGMDSELFSRGHSRLSLYGGSGSAFNNQYFVLGVGAGYYLISGLEAGVDGEAWFGNKPKIYKVTPQMRYVFYQSPNMKPYVGAFYRRTVFDTLADLDSYGGRVGLITSLGSRLYAGFGLVYEQYAHCDSKIYTSCSATYPELNLSLGF